jgi:hypothetical protein
MRSHINSTIRQAAVHMLGFARRGGRFERLPSRNLVGLEIFRVPPCLSI